MGLCYDAYISSKHALEDISLNRRMVSLRRRALQSFRIKDARTIEHQPNYASYFTRLYKLKVRMAALVRETKGDAKGAAGASGARGQQKGDLEANHKCANHCIEIHIKIIEQ